MWWSVHQPQWGSPELRHSPQVVYCSQDSTGTRDTCKGTKHTAQRSSTHSKPNLSGSRPRFGGLSPITQQRFTKFVATSVQKSEKNKKYWGQHREAAPSLGCSHAVNDGGGTSLPETPRLPPRDAPRSSAGPLLPSLQVSTLHLA